MTRLLCRGVLSKRLWRPCRAPANVSQSHVASLSNSVPSTKLTPPMPAGFDFTCSGALVIDNAGNVPLAFSGLESFHAILADGTPCNASSFAPTARMTCTFVWTVSEADAEAGSGSISLAVAAKEAGQPAANSTTYSALATLAVPQHPAMSTVFETVTAGPHSSNSEQYSHARVVRVMLRSVLSAERSTSDTTDATNRTPCALPSTNSYVLFGVPVQALKSF